MSRQKLTPEELAAKQELELQWQEKNKRLAAIIKPVRDPLYAVDVSLGYMEDQLDFFATGYGLNLYPDFQRGHVWTMEQRSRYVESLLRGTIGASLRVIQFNAPHWDDDNHGGDLPNEIQIIDGLQRLTTIRMFIAGRVQAFGMYIGEFKGSSFDPMRGLYGLRFAVYAYNSRAELLKYYLSLNDGGTPHAPEEISRVRSLLSDAMLAARGQP